jgi:hypothetical protein
MWWLYVKQIVPVVICLALVVGGAYYGYYHVLKKDGVPCERDVHCPERVCIRDVQGFYCSRPCDSAADCLDGWRCVVPPGEPGRAPSCVRPRPRL